jgi:molybdate transport system substrate-binding protein
VTGSLAAAKLTVFAAASLTGAFPQVDKAPRYNFAGSDQLAFQITQGAPADVYAAASPKYPAQLFTKGLVYKPRVFATNELVVIVPQANDANIDSVYDLRKRGLRIVIGAKGVPVGDYTRKALAAIGLSSVLKNVVSEETDVKGIAAKVALGEADAGFVYRTDGKHVASRTRSIALPNWAQPAIRYELAVVKSSSHRTAAQAFIKKVVSKRGRLLLARAGFGLPKKP